MTQLVQTFQQQSFLAHIHVRDQLGDLASHIKAPCLKTLHFMVILVGTFLSAGCLPDRLAPDGNAGKFYQPYVGTQTNWPTAPAAFVTTQGRLPIYHGLPPKPYTLLGRFDRPNIPLFRVAKVAHREHADAILLSEQDLIEIVHSASVTLGPVTLPATTSKRHAALDTAYLIKFTP